MYLAEVLDQLLECRVAEALGELAAMAVTVLLGPVSHGEQPGCDSLFDRAAWGSQPGS